MGYHRFGRGITHHTGKGGYGKNGKIDSRLKSWREKADKVARYCASGNSIKDACRQFNLSTATIDKMLQFVGIKYLKKNKTK